MTLALTFPKSLSGYLHGCPSGYLGDPVHECKCSSQAVTRYQKKISGPLMDRIDIFLDIPRIDYEKMIDDRPAERSDAVRQRVQAARERQLARFKENDLHCNADMTAVEVKQYCTVDIPAQGLLKTAMRQIHFTARAFHRTLKLARTIADLDRAEIIGSTHLAEALQYRQRNINM